MRLSATDGSPCGVINLAFVLDNVDLQDGQYVLSMRDEYPLAYVSYKDGTKAHGEIFGSFSLRDARARLRPTVHKDGRHMVEIGVESPNVPDFLALSAKIYGEVLRIPIRTFEKDQEFPGNLTFIDGIRNALGRLRRYIAEQLKRMRLIRA